MSIKSSLKSTLLLTSSPSLHSPILASISKIPLPISARPSSLAAQIIPSESIPRSFTGFIVKPPGICAPSVATATLSPARTFEAPHTIWRIDEPIST